MRHCHSASSFDTPPITDLVALPSHDVVRLLEDNAALAASVAALPTPPTEFLELDMGDGLCFRKHSFDGAISVSAGAGGGAGDLGGGLGG